MDKTGHKNFRNKIEDIVKENSKSISADKSDITWFVRAIHRAAKMEETFKHLSVKKLLTESIKSHG